MKNGLYYSENHGHLFLWVKPHLICEKNEYFVLFLSKKMFLALRLVWIGEL